MGKFILRQASGFPGLP